MMMDWAHAEHALARRLERDDLDDDGERFADKDEADDDEQELRMRQDADGRERAAEREAARVAHEDFRGVRIEAQEAEAGRGNRDAEQREVGMARQHGDDGERTARNRHFAGREAVEAVREVHGIRRADEHEEHERIIEPAEIDVDICPRNPDARIDAEHLRADVHRDDGDEDLARELLPRLKAEVAFLDDLDVVVEEAEHEMAEHDEEREENLRRPRRGHERRERDAADDHDAAHRRRAALCLMALRAFLADALAELELMKFRDEERPRQEHEARGDDGRDDDLL